MIRHHHVITYENGTQAWWLTLPGMLSFIRKIEYHTGDTVFFNVDGTVECTFASDGFENAE